jgi:hypothetical protein
MHRPVHDTDHEERPPILGTWPRLYGAVLGWLLLLIVVFYFFARSYAP